MHNVSIEQYEVTYFAKVHNRTIETAYFSQSIFSLSHMNSSLRFEFQQFIHITFIAVQDINTHFTLCKVYLISVSNCVMKKVKAKQAVTLRQCELNLLRHGV